MGKLLLLLAAGVGLWFLMRPKPADGSGGFMGSLVTAVAPKPRVAPPPPAPVAPLYVPPPVGPVAAVEAPRGDSVKPDAVQASHGAPVGSTGPMGGVSNGKGYVERVSTGNASMDVPPSWGCYAFKNRAVPGAEFLQAWKELGLDAICDPVARKVTFRGQNASVDAFKEACAAMDVVPGSCCVQAWTVYVDRSVQKGFDLVAALGAVVGDGDGTSVAIGPGGLTLDVGLDKVAAALNVIADGSSVEVVQNPYVRLVDSKEARVEAIQEYPILETSLASGGIAQSSVKFRKVGLQLSVTPMFLDGGRVRLGVVQTNGLVGATVQVADNEVPVIQSQTVETAAELSVGQTLVLGGVRTVRRVEEKSWFSKVDKFTEGTLYVILSTYEDTPRALPVDSPQLEDPGLLDVSPPLTVPYRAEGVLPLLFSSEEERQFIRGRGGK